jgi:N-acetylglutamate synthase-like GNAT family acetyltransferase
MAPSESLAIERLAAGDVEAGLRLSDGVRWNQTADDWAHFIAHGAFGLRDDADGLVATAAALPYGARVGWISMVLVDARHRHRGHATRLLTACVDALRAAGRVPVLDATPEGAAVYRQHGFVAGFSFERWQRDALPSERDASLHGDRDAAAATVVVDARARDALLALDHSLWGLDRSALLCGLLARPSTRAWLDADASGFAVLRAGRRAAQLGPIVAASGRSAIALLDRALVAASGAVFIDVPASAQALVAALSERGFVRQRPFVRMALGDTLALHGSARAFAVAGPEFG